MESFQLDVFSLLAALSSVLAMVTIFFFLIRIFRNPWRLLSPQKKPQEKRAVDAMWRGEVAGEAAVSGVGGGEREGGRDGERERGQRENKNEKRKVRSRKKISDVHTGPVVAADAVRPDG